MSVDKEAEYGGRAYLEKNDFIIQNQQIRLGKVNEELLTQEEKLEAVSIDMAAVNTMINCVADAAYLESCNIIVPKMAMHIINGQVNDVMKEADAETDPDGNVYSALERKALQRFVKKVVDTLQNAKERWVRVFHSLFLGPTCRRENVEKVKAKVREKMEELATTGPKDEEIVISKDISEKKPENVTEQVHEQVQEVATQMVRRRRGR